MSKCDISLEFDRADRTYAVGEMVTGTVHVHVNRDCKCNALTLERYWETHGRGNTTRGDEASGGLLFQGNWLAGETCTYPFSFPAPHGPVTYRGDYLNVDWHLTARADIPWAIDPKVTEDFLLGVSDPVGDLNLGPEYTPTEQVLTSEPESTGCLTTFGFLAVLGGLIAFGASAGAPIGLMIGFCGFLLGGVLLFFAFRNQMAAHRCGAVQVELTHSPVEPGEDLEVEVRLHPTSRFKLNGIVTQLTGKEIVVSGSGTNCSTHTNIFFEEHMVCATGERMQPGTEAGYSAHITLPDHAPLTFNASDNEVRWTLSVRIDIPNWPDWTQEWTVTVAPRLDPHEVDAVTTPDVLIETSALPGDASSDAPPMVDPGANEAKSGVLGALTGAVAQAVDAVSGLPQTAGDFVKEGAQNVAGAVSDAGQKAKAFVQDGAQDVADAMSAAGDKVESTVKDGAAKAANAIGATGKVGTVVKGGAQILTEAVAGAATNVVKGGAQMAKGVATGDLGDVLKGGVKIAAGAAAATGKGALIKGGVHIASGLAGGKGTAAIAAGAAQMVGGTPAKVLVQGAQLVANTVKGKGGKEEETGKESGAAPKADEVGGRPTVIDAEIVTEAEVEVEVEAEVEAEVEVEVEAEPARPVSQVDLSRALETATDAELGFGTDTSAVVDADLGFGSEPIEPDDAALGFGTMVAPVSDDDLGFGSEQALLTDSDSDLGFGTDVATSSDAELGFGSLDENTETVAVLADVPEGEADIVIEAEPEAEPETVIETEPEAEPEAVIETEPEAEAETVIEAEPEAEPETVIEAEAEPETVIEAELADLEPENEPDTRPDLAPAELVEAVNTVNNALSFDDTAAAAFKALLGRPMTVQVDVERVDRTSGQDVTTALQDGRTLLGRIHGTEIKVAVRLPASQNEALDALSYGATFTTSCEARAWDSLYRRVDMNAT